MDIAATTIRQPDGTRSRQVRTAKRVRLAAAFLLMMVSGVVWNSFGLFLVALEGEFHWSRASISGAYSLFALVSALTAPFFGQLLGRYDSRRLLAATSLLLGLAYGAASMVGNLTQFWLAFGVLGGLGTQCVSSYAIFAVLAGRFRKRPATAMSFADAGSGLAAFLGIPIIHWIIDGFGWRAALLSIGLLTALVAVPLHLFVLDRVRSGPGPERRSSPLGQLPVYIFVLLIVSYFCGSAVYHGLLTQQIALFEERHIGDSAAVWLAAVAGLVVFIWRLVSGWLCDLWGPNRVMLIAGVAAAAAFASLVTILAGEHQTMLLIYPLVLGVGFGGQQVLLASGTRLIVSLSSLAGMLGFCRLASGVGMAAGPIIAGVLYDATGGYALVVGVLAGLAFCHFASFSYSIK